MGWSQQPKIKCSCKISSIKNRIDKQQLFLACIGCTMKEMRQLVILWPRVTRVNNVSQSERLFPFYALSQSKYVKFTPGKQKEWKKST